MPTKALIPLPANFPDVGDVSGRRISIPNDPEWIGMFWGTLDELTRWNSYDRDDTHLAKDVAARWRLLFEQSRAINAPICPSFYLSAETSPDCASTPDNFVAFDVPNCDGCDPSAPMFTGAAVAKQTLQPNANIGWVFRALDDDRLVGGRICRISVGAVQPNGQALPHFDWHYTDCLNVEHSESIDSTFWTRTDVDCWAVCITCSVHFSVMLALTGGPICTIA